MYDYFDRILLVPSFGGFLYIGPVVDDARGWQFHPDTWSRGRGPTV